jgi:hypothetical protein
MNTFLAATYHPAERPSREEKKKQKKKEAAMKDETSILPTRSQSKQSHSSTSSRTSSNPSAASVARSRPALAARNNSAPSVPLSSTSTNTTTTTSTIRDPKVVDADDLPNLHSHSHRDSVASIKDDPFFRNYQSPHSVSLNREMMAASYEEDDDDDDDEDDSPLEPLSRSSKRDSVNLPVRISCSLEEPPKLT